ncbi:MAG: glycosyltransferase family 4 protein [Flavobacteriaceae bacterium]|nr:glycosyltransferase family 4 protein [Flavobacteriaceae bacterium]
MKTVLYITWDSDQTNYLESLFFPIFDGVQIEGDYQFIVYQFSWASLEEVDRIRRLALGQGVDYIHHPVPRKKGRLQGTLEALLKGREEIKKLIRNRAIEIIMPRSTLPAILINSIYGFLRKHHLKIVFEADGFPIQERIDFSGLAPDSIQTRFFLQQEGKLLFRAHAILTRSYKAIDIHLKKIGEDYRSKFFVASNGRDPDFFYFRKEKREEIREALGIKEGEFCWVYVGSLGPAYGNNEMIAIFDQAQARFGNLRFLILPNDLTYAKNHLNSEFPDRIHIHSVPFAEIPNFLSAADIGISFRKNAPSLAGLFPIKLGEYLLCGLPILGSLNMGDAADYLSDKKFVLALDLDKTEEWYHSLESLPALAGLDREAIRAFALEYFSLEKSVRTYLNALDFSSSE